MKLLNSLSVLLLTSSFFILPACKKGDKNDSPQTLYGPITPLGQGTMRSFVTLNTSGKPVTIGMKFSASALTGLATDSTKEWEYPLELPAQAKITGFDHLAVDWNPAGHEPKPIYGLPHFDFHFYRISKEEQAQVVAGPDTTLVPADYIPQDYISGMVAVPDMGVHWIDPKAPEFMGQRFTDTFIYGFYHGELTFMEPMITLEFLKSKPDLSIQIKQPKAFQKQGYYPTISHISYDDAAKEYTLALEGLNQGNLK